MNKARYAVHAAENEAFLEENSKKPNIIITSSGLQYEVVSMGNGQLPNDNNTVAIHYTGSSIDGTIFDSSIQRGEEATFLVNSVIPGFAEAIKLMPVGSKFKLYIPAEIAYGAEGIRDLVQPYSTVIFDVELLGIVE